MNDKAVTSDLRYLEWFMNLPTEVLRRWDRNEPMPDIQNDWDNRMMHRRLFYLSDDRDDGQTLLKVQEDLRSDIGALLDPNTPANEALKQLLYRIDELKLASGRKVLTLEEQHKAETENDPFTIVDVLRVSPPRVGEKGRRKPVTESLPVREIAWYESARKNLYRMVDGAIRANVISDLRQCLSCNKFFLRDGRRLTYCTDRCETEFNNKRRTDSGYFKDRPAIQKSRKTQKQIPEKGYDVFVKFRALIAQGSKANKQEQAKRDFIQRWANLDAARSARAFMEKCAKLSPREQWQDLEPTQKRRFESCPMSL